MKKTNEYIKIVLINGKEQKKTIYIDESGEKFIYNQKGFFKMEDFVRNRKVIYPN